MKSIKLSAIAYEMLLELSKKKRVKPEAFIEGYIKNEYLNSK